MLVNDPLLLLRPHIVPSVIGLVALRRVLHICSRQLRLRLIKWTLERPLDSDRVRHSVDENLVMHGLLRKLCEVAMSVLDECIEASLVEIDVFNFSHLREVLVKQPHDVANRHSFR